MFHKDKTTLLGHYNIKLYTPNPGYVAGSAFWCVKSLRGILNIYILLFVSDPKSLGLMIKKQQTSRQSQMDSFLDKLSEKYSTKKKRGTKRKAPPGGPAAKTSRK